MRSMIGRELNVRYVLEGSVQRGRSRMRVNVQLIDAETGSHLWAERFDKPLADLFDMQDEIVARLAGALNTELVAAEARRAERSPTPDSMDLYFQGLAWLNKGPTPSNLRASAQLFRSRALSRPRQCRRARRIGIREPGRGRACPLSPIPSTAFAAAEAKLTKALSSGSRPRAWPHVVGACRHFRPSAPRRASPNVNTVGAGSKSRRSPCLISDLARFSSVAPKKPRLMLLRPYALVPAIRWLTPG